MSHLVEGKFTKYLHKVKVYLKERKSKSYVYLLLGRKDTTNDGLGNHIAGVVLADVGADARCS